MTSYVFWADPPEKKLGEGFVSTTWGKWAFTHLNYFCLLKWIWGGKGCKKGKATLFPADKPPRTEWPKFWPKSIKRLFFWYPIFRNWNRDFFSETNFLIQKFFSETILQSWNWDFLVRPNFKNGNRDFFSIPNLSDTKSTFGGGLPKKSSGSDQLLSYLLKTISPL